jgi:hypothetical protein
MTREFNMKNTIATLFLTFCYQAALSYALCRLPNSALPTNQATL